MDRIKKSLDVQCTMNWHMSYIVTAGTCMPVMHAHVYLVYGMVPAGIHKNFIGVVTTPSFKEIKKEIYEVIFGAKVAFLNRHAFQIDKKEIDAF